MVRYLTAYFMTGSVAKALSALSLHIIVVWTKLVISVSYLFACLPVRVTGQLAEKSLIADAATNSSSKYVGNN